jgi:hypothetical protein
LVVVLGVQLAAQLVPLAQPRLLGQGLDAPATQLPDPSQVAGVSMPLEQVEPQVPEQQWPPRQRPLTHESFETHVPPAPCRGRHTCVLVSQ